MNLHPRHSIRERWIVWRANRRGYIHSRHATPLLLLYLEPYVALRLTAEQAASIDRIVAQRKPLPEPPMPIEED